MQTADSVIVGEKYVSVRGIRTRYYDYGQGQPLVLFHGGEPGSLWWADAWLPVISLLARDFRVIVPDRVGQGYTDNPVGDEGYLLAAIRRHLSDFLDELGIRQAAVAGHSRGAFLAAQLACARPEMVSRLVLANSSSLAPALAGQSAAVALHVRGGPENVRRDAEWYAADTTCVTGEFVARTAAMLAGPQRTADRAVMARLQAEVAADRTREKDLLLAQIRRGGARLPVMVIWGAGGDPLTRLSDGIDTYSLFEQAGSPARLYVISQCGHSPFAERPAEFADVVSAFCGAGS